MNPGVPGTESVKGTERQTDFGTAMMRSLNTHNRLRSIDFCTATSSSNGSCEIEFTICVNSGGKGLSLIELIELDSIFVLYDDAIVLIENITSSSLFYLFLSRDVERLA